ncbi:hypothetical protein RW1_009_00240 [Rhodococcus wratislaviensis NBRC 100605]|uniref:Uncharacterized protein n=1 Tax=Rhodococcus wratislaviensis NBRC 100605 TaxID=1219028 RepID=X0QYB3_RHOWR|nr:hypothetical protein RW1_009_00240 [Rhodococcus wratislaviensis NBRC 100605]
MSIRPCHGSAWAPRSKPHRLPATYRRTHGIRHFHGCYSLGDDQRWGVTRRRKGGDHSLAAFTSIRAARPDGEPVYDPGGPCGIDVAGELRQCPTTCRFLGHIGLNGIPAGQS